MTRATKETVSSYSNCYQHTSKYKMHKLHQMYILKPCATANKPGDSGLCCCYKHDICLVLLNPFVSWFYMLWVCTQTVIKTCCTDWLPATDSCSLPKSPTTLCEFDSQRCLFCEKWLQHISPTDHCYHTWARLVDWYSQNNSLAYMHNPDWLLPQNIRLTVEVCNPVGLTATDVCLPTCSDIRVGVSKQWHDKSDALRQALQGLLFLGHLLQKDTPRQKTFTLKGHTLSENLYSERTPHQKTFPVKGHMSSENLHCEWTLCQKTFIENGHTSSESFIAKGHTSWENLHCKRTHLIRKPSLWKDTPHQKTFTVKGHTLSENLHCERTHLVRKA